MVMAWIFCEVETGIWYIFLIGVIIQTISLKIIAPKLYILNQERLQTVCEQNLSKELHAFKYFIRFGL